MHLEAFGRDDVVERSSIGPRDVAEAEELADSRLGGSEGWECAIGEAGCAVLDASFLATREMDG